MIEAPGPNELVIPFCGALPGELNRAGRGQSRWRNKRQLKWAWIDRIPGLSIDKQIADTEWAFAQWSTACNGFLEFSAAKGDNAAKLCDILLTTTRLDGPSRVLADMQLPPGDDRQLRGRFDTGEAWDKQIRFDLVLLHELGHAMGLDHISGALAVLNAMYNPRLSELQPADVAEMLRIYPEAVNYQPTPSQPTPIPTPTPTIPTGPTDPTADGPVIWTINIPTGPHAGTYRGPMKRML
jgi:hypothetical protein